MTGPEHYQEAERLIAAARAESGGMYRHHPTEAAVMLTEAQVHAALALAAATALGTSGTDGQAWASVAGTSRPGSA